MLKRDGNNVTVGLLRVKLRNLSEGSHRSADSDFVLQTHDSCRFLLFLLE